MIINLIDSNISIYNNLNSLLNREKINLNLCNDLKDIKIEDQLVDIFIISSFKEKSFDINYIRKIKELYEDSYIIKLSNSINSYDQILFLELGADDCFELNINPQFLLSKIKAIIRRKNTVRSYKLQNTNTELKNFYYLQSSKWNIKVNLSKRTVSVKEKEIEVSKIEFDILKYLMENVDVIKSRDDLIDNIKGFYSESIDRTIDSQVCSLRKKLGDNKPFKMIKTIRSLGYIFCES